MASAPSEVLTPAVPRARVGRIALYCPALPPSRGGVADHTLLLARALSAAGADVAVLGRTGDAEIFRPIEALTGVTPSGAGPDLVAAARQVGASAVLVQYVPFLFGRLGLAPALVTALRRLRRSGVRVALFVHEPYVPFTRPVWWLTGLPMRWQFRALVRSADVVFSHVPAFLDLARPAARRATRLVPAPVGAIIPVAQLSRADARSALGLTDADVAVGVFCPRASGMRADWIAHAAQSLAGERVRWIFFGNGGDVPPDGFPTSAPHECLGWLEPQRASLVFRAVDAAAAPYDDGLTLRRTSAMAALAHGVPLASSRGGLFDPSLAEAALCAGTPAEFAEAVGRLVMDPALRGRQGRRGREIYETQGSVEVFAARLLAELGAGVTK